MSCWTADMFFILIVICPGVAVAVFDRYFSCPVGSASISRTPAFSTAAVWATFWTRLGELARVLAGHARDATDVGGDVRGLAPLEEPGGHHAAAVRGPDPVGDEPLDRGAVDPVGAILTERIVEVRADAAVGGGVRERVAGAALGDE